VLNQAANQAAAIDAQAIAKYHYMRELFFRAASLGTDRVRQRLRQQFAGLLAIGIHIQANLGAAHLRVLEMDRRGDQRVVGHLGVADLARGGTAEDVRHRVGLTERPHQLGILQNHRRSEDEYKLRGLRHRPG